MINNVNLFSEIPKNCIYNITDYSPSDTRFMLSRVSKQFHKAASIGFKITNIKNCPSYKKQFKTTLQKTGEVINLLIYFDLSNIVEKIEKIVSDIFNYDKTARDYVLIRIAEAAFIQKGKLEDALEIAKKIPEGFFHYKSSILKSIAKAYIQKGKLEDALEIAKKIPDYSYKSSVLELIAAEVPKTKKNLEKAEELLEKALEIAKNTPSYDPDESCNLDLDNELKTGVFKSIAAAYLKIGNVNRFNMLRSLYCL